MTLSDQAFLHQFEACELEPEHFNHKGHLRLAWLYLNRHALPQAIERTTSGIEKYAISLGAKDKFHYTLTEATVRLMAKRCETQNSSSFDTFVSNNADLVEDLPRLLFQHYSKEVLFADKAKRAFVAPDLAPIGERI